MPWTRRYNIVCWARDVATRTLCYAGGTCTTSALPNVQPASYAKLDFNGSLLRFS